MRELSFTDQELETLRVALLSAHYSALDEERVLRDRLDGLPRASDEALKTDHSRSMAALRAMRYGLLAERVLAERHAVSPAVVTGENTAGSSH